MSDIGWAVLENIVIVCAICFLIWLTNSYWWALFILFGNSFKIKK
jgi:hypothetical protein